MGVLTDLVVAPLDDAPALLATRINDRAWPWVDMKGLGIDGLVALHCLIDGCDPDEPVTPPEWLVNPFTKAKMPVTMFSRYLNRFEMAGEEDEIVVLRVPRALVESLARLGPTEVFDLARRFTIAKSSQRYGDGRPVPAFPKEIAADYLEHVIAMAKTAAERHHELFVWMCP